MNYRPSIAVQLILVLMLQGIGGMVLAAEDGVTQGNNDNQENALDNRLKSEIQTLDNPFSITPHKPNYLLPLSYNNSPNDAPFTNFGSDNLSNWEIKFQFSFKVPIAQDLFGRRGQLDFAYTQISFWQAYAASNSSPFRETNHEPEIMLTFGNDFKLFGFTNRLVTLGLSHQSNGRTEPLSRSWNRLYAAFVFERNNLVFSIKPWLRIPESASSDDNPDIEDYMGHGEVTLVYAKGLRSRSATWRYNALKNRGAFQLNWTFPLKSKYKGYVQYFNGYGESLVDYDARSNRIGFGILLTDWL